MAVILAASIWMNFANVPMLPEPEVRLTPVAVTTPAGLEMLPEPSAVRLATPPALILALMMMPPFVPTPANKFVLPALVIVLLTTSEELTPVELTVMLLPVMPLMRTGPAYVSVMLTLPVVLATT